MTPSWSTCQKQRLFDVFQKSSWDRFGIVLGSFWDRFGIVLESFWGRFGFVLASLWGRVGVVLGQSCNTKITISAVNPVTAITKIIIKRKIL